MTSLARCLVAMLDALNGRVGALNAVLGALASWLERRYVYPAARPRYAGPVIVRPDVTWPPHEAA